MRRLRDVANREGGLTMIELLVAMGLFAVLLTIVVGTFVSITKATSFAAARDTNTRVATNGMDELTKMIRSAADNPVVGAGDTPAFTVAGPETMTFSTLVSSGRDAVPQQITFALDGARNLTETSAAASANGTYFTFGTPGAARVVTASVGATPSGGDPLFQYRDGGGNVLTPSTTTNQLTLDQRNQIASVTVTLRIANTRSTLTNGVVLKNTIGLPNLLEPTGSST
ncbi:PulJ/GspJ family protein [Curtobacterium sp. Leaf261]|uniref:PulJ/GspJ family protein n=1 Tax=Curtobacterium sp. Leaf261 TaxID=1736311 RepID=UPI0006F36611|nr:hypothetical protein ASF23_05295 [Curtobacterium sp. Leaf261]